MFFFTHHLLYVTVYVYFLLIFSYFSNKYQTLFTVLRKSMPTLLSHKSYTKVSTFFFVESYTKGASGMLLFPDFTKKEATLTLLSC